jgi:hypothetical protein
MLARIMGIECKGRLPSNVENPAPTLKLDGNGAWWCDPQDYSGFGLKSQTPTPKSARGLVPGLKRSASRHARDMQEQRSAGDGLAMMVRIGQGVRTDSTN